MGELNQKHMIMEELNALDYKTLSTAYLYAKNFHSYGVDVTEKWLTATQQSAALSKAYRDGYYYGLKIYEEQEQRPLFDKMEEEFGKDWDVPKDISMKEGE